MTSTSIFCISEEGSCAHLGLLNLKDGCGGAHLCFVYEKYGGGAHLCYVYPKDALGCVLFI
jgi:hypothetical protein